MSGCTTWIRKTDCAALQEVGPDEVFRLVGTMGGGGTPTPTPIPRSFTNTPPPPPSSPSFFPPLPPPPSNCKPTPTATPTATATPTTHSDGKSYSNAQDRPPRQDLAPLRYRDPRIPKVKCTYENESKISAYILRGSTTALLFSCVLVALCSAIHLPEQRSRLSLRRITPSSARMHTRAGA